MENQEVSENSDFSDSGSYLRSHRQPGIRLQNSLGTIVRIIGIVIVRLVAADNIYFLKSSNFVDSSLDAAPSAALRTVMEFLNHGYSLSD